MLYYQVVDKIASQAINLNDKEHIQNIEILLKYNLDLDLELQYKFRKARWI